MEYPNPDIAWYIYLQLDFCSVLQLMQVNRYWYSFLRYVLKYKSDTAKFHYLLRIYISGRCLPETRKYTWIQGNLYRELFLYNGMLTKFSQYMRCRYNDDKKYYIPNLEIIFRPRFQIDIWSDNGEMICRSFGPEAPAKITESIMAYVNRVIQKKLPLLA